jgi:nitrite reductase/ring-hydroxylating ferredoxin subunit/uncharacterized protein YecT (DUF1311 family)
MDGDENWLDVGSKNELSEPLLRRIKAENRELAISFRDGKFGAVSNMCNHAGGPLGEGRLDDEYIVCPWHNWRFHRCSGVGEPGFEGDRVPAYPVKVENGRVLVNLAAGSKRAKSPHEPHPLSRKVARAAGPLRLAGIATTAMDAANPRFSGSDHLLDHALKSRPRTWRRDADDQVERLNNGYKRLIAKSEPAIAASYRKIQRAWIAYRDARCAHPQIEFQGSMAGPMEAFCLMQTTADQSLWLGTGED